jgi:uncharacterized protein (DUF2236 family)
MTVTVKLAASREAPAAALPAEPLGPGSILWYAAGDLRIFLVAVRALMFQVAHPMVGAGVGEHSVYKTDPYGRLWRTSKSVTRQVYGGVASAEEGQRLIRMHADIKGTDDQGRRYHALNPEAYLWVHATMFETYLLFLNDFGPGLTEAQEQQLFEEWRRMGLLIGVKESVLPRTQDEFWSMWARVEDTLENNYVVQDLLHTAPRKPPYAPLPQAFFDWLARPLLRRQREVIAVTVSPELRGRFGLPTPTPRTQRRVRAMMRRSRLVGHHLPDFVRLAVLAQLTMRKTRTDPRTRPAAIPYP